MKCDSCDLVKRLIEVIVSDEDSCSHCGHAKSDTDNNGAAFYYCDNKTCDFTLKNM